MLYSIPAKGSAFLPPRHPLAVPRVEKPDSHSANPQAASRLRRVVQTTPPPVSQFTVRFAETLRFAQPSLSSYGAAVSQSLPSCLFLFCTLYLSPALFVGWYESRLNTHNIHPPFRGLSLRSEFGELPLVHISAVTCAQAHVRTKYGAPAHVNQPLPVKSGTMQEAHRSCRLYRRRRGPE